MRVVPAGLRKESDKLPQGLVPLGRGAVHRTHPDAAICLAALAETAEPASGETLPALPVQASTGELVPADRGASDSPNPLIHERQPDWMTDWPTGITDSGEIEPEANKKAVDSIPTNRGDSDSPSAKQRLK